MNTYSNISIQQQMDNEYNECRFFHNTLDGNIYHVTCKLILQDSISLDDYNYDHGFFYQCSTANYYVTCKLLSRPSIVNILNKKVFGMDLDVNNNSKQGESLSLDQKLSLEQDLRQVLPFNFIQYHISKREIDERTDSFLTNNHKACEDYTHDNNITQHTDSTIPMTNIHADGLFQQNGENDDRSHSVEQQDILDFLPDPLNYYNINTSQAIPETYINENQNYNYNDLSYNNDQNIDEYNNIVYPQYHVLEETKLDNIDYNVMAVSTTNIYNENGFSCNDQDGNWTLYSYHSFTEITTIG